ncbi:DUF1214 domain-containing protein [Ancylobacter terrae]|uniref:DUF1214 domain-containing protein n=1 Tax=Ancylobacter sp. sgz301288 TaxID=3342077 RepID=UPI00385EC2A0
MRALPYILTLAIGATVGLGLTWAATRDDYGFGTVKAGPWRAWPKSGTEDADPYARATFARSGELPIELADGLAFIATRDSEGRALDGRCDIRLVGKLPQARYWTLTLTDQRGRLIDNVAGRYGFTSAEVVWTQDGNAEIVVAPRARPGNWLPSGARDRLMLTLRLYDAPVGLATRTSDAPEMPAIITERCP